MKNLKKKNMDTVNSFMQIRQDDKGTWIGTVINGLTEIPTTALRVPDNFKFTDGMVINLYHRPDCAWFTESME
jgi:hypothetical protein